MKTMIKNANASAPVLSPPGGGAILGGDRASRLACIQAETACWICQGRPGLIS